MIIAVMGTPCSGKSTLAKHLAKKLGYTHYSLGDLRRKAAKERGLTLAQFNKLGEGAEDTDTEFDEYQQRLGREEDDFVVDGRLSKFFIPHALSIYLDADEEVRAQRMINDLHHQETEQVEELTKAREMMRARTESDRRRYERLYGYDPFNSENYEIVINSTNLSVEEMFDAAYKEVERHIARG